MHRLRSATPRLRLSRKSQALAAEACDYKTRHADPLRGKQLANQPEGRALLAQLTDNAREGHQDVLATRPGRRHEFSRDFAEALDGNGDVDGIIHYASSTGQRADDCAVLGTTILKLAMQTTNR
jgi:hypothetical protein